MPGMSRYILPLPHIKFDREWVLGPVTFRPAGALLAEAENLPDFTAQVKNYRLALDQVQEMAKAWAPHATVEVESGDNANAETLVRQAVAVLRLFMRPEVSVNVWLHKIGLVGDLSLAIREYISIDHSGRVGFGSRRVDGPSHSPLHTLCSTSGMPIRGYSFFRRNLLVHRRSDLDLVRGH
jgi:hypothetical protein